MELGVFLPYQVNRPENIEGLYDRMLSYAIKADRCGYERIWVPEHHLVQFLATPSALLDAVQIGQHVGCRVGTAVVVLPYHGAVQLAGEIAAADHMLGGRLDLGVARGAWKYEFDILGVDFERSLPRFIETLDAMLTLWRNEDERSSFSGEFVNFEGAYVWPRPVQRPHPPIWIGAVSPPAVEDAAARGYNVVHTLWFRDEDNIRTVMESFRKGQARAPEGGERTKMSMTRYAFAVDDPADLDDRLDEILNGHRIQLQLHHAVQDADPRGIVEPLPFDGEPTKDEMREVCLVGTPDEILEKMRWYRDAGIDVLTMHTCFGAPHELTLRSIEILGELGRRLRDEES